MIGGGELEQGDGSRALLVVGLVGENDAVVVDIDGLLRVSTTLFVNVDAATVSVGPSNWGVARGDLGEGTWGIPVRGYIREAEDLAVDEELHSIVIQAGLGMLP